MSRAAIGEALARAERRLERAGVESARRDAELLLAWLLDTDAGSLWVRRDEPLESSLVQRYAAAVDRRARREPLQHVTGSQEFYGLTFRTDSRALVPRPETEGLIDRTLALELGPDAEAIDLGTGSGCIAITLACRCPGLKLVALDASSAALELARENAELHGVERRVELIRGDMRKLPEAWLGRFDLVVSNPPYVSETEWAGLDPEVRDHDPRAALVAGASGLEMYRALAPVALRLLRPGGYLLLELGYDQANPVREQLASAGFEAIELTDDLRGIPRVLQARRTVKDRR